MKPLAEGARAQGGLILGNDVTDRAMLLRHVDPLNPQSGRGFTSGKSAAGFLPVGNLFVVPRDLGAFVAKLTLRLSVNGEERQHAPVTQWIWDFDEILRRSEMKRGTVWAYWGGSARLSFTAGGVPARTLLMAGTPAGTVFKGLAPADYLRGLADWLCSLGRKPVARCVVERHISAARAGRTYLQPGDEVAIRADCLGSLANKVTR